MTSFRLYLLGLLVLFGGYVALEYYRPKPLDWRPTLSSKDKIPYGTFALYDVLPQLLGTEEAESIRQPIYNQFFDEDEPALAADTTKSAATPQPDSATAATTPDSTTAAASPDSATATARVVPPAPAQADSLTTTETEAQTDEENTAPNLPARPTSYLFINTYFSASKAETQALLSFAAAGNDVFIAAGRFDSVFTNALGVRVLDVDTARAPSLRASDSVQVKLAGLALAPTSLRLPAWAAATYLAPRAGHTASPLATDAQGRAVLLRIGYGRGQVYLCSVPLAFANYFVLPPRSRRFALGALSYLPTGHPVWWDEYQKQGRIGEQSVLRVIMGSESLRLAYYLLLGTALLFVFFEARRRQRIIPVIRPLPNTTLLFTRTVASLYQQGRNHARIAEKKVALFLDYLRTRFHEPAPDLGDNDFRERLSQKAGVPRPRVDELVRLINFARTAPTVTDRELLILSQAIRDFKQESK